MFQFVGKLNYRQSYDKENDSKLKKKNAKKISSILIHREIKIEKKKKHYEPEMLRLEKIKKKSTKKRKKKKKKENEEREGKKY